MATKPYPSETQERFIVRLPDGMRDHIAEAAKANNRSMNAEIISRLTDSFINEAHMEKFGKPHDPAPPGINVILDSRGYPQSWDEILEHLRAIRDALKVEAVAMNTVVVSPPLASSTDRQGEADALRNFYRGKGKRPSAKSSDPTPDSDLEKGREPVPATKTIRRTRPKKS